MRSQGKRARRICCVLVVVLGFGCQMEEVPGPVVERPSVGKDPCADRLHDLCGPLLLHFGTHGRLPETLSELAGTGPVELVCPESGLAYVYEPGGLSVPGLPGLLVLYDATPCHSGMRWGILLDDAAPGKTLTARVVLLSEEAVRSAGKKP